MTSNARPLACLSFESWLGACCGPCLHLTCVGMGCAVAAPAAASPDPAPPCPSAFTAALPTLLLPDVTGSHESRPLGEAGLAAWCGVGARGTGCKEVRRNASGTSRERKEANGWANHDAAMMMGIRVYVSNP